MSYILRFVTAAALGCALASFAIPAGSTVASASPALANPVVFVSTPGTGAPPATLGSRASMLYSMLPFGADPQPTFTAVTGVTGPTESLTPTGTIGTGSIGFSAPLGHCRVGGCWATWSNGYAGDVYTTGGQSVTITLPETNAFYFYAEPQQFATLTITATTANGTTSGPQSVSGNAGARYFGFYTTGTSPLTSITVTTTDPTGFAVGEFGIAAPYQFVLPDAYITNPALLIQRDQVGVGVNIPIGSGTPYYAVTSGTVSHIVSPACGYGTILHGDDGVTYIYCNSQLLLVPSGTHVAAGTELGLTGMGVLPPDPSLSFQVSYSASPWLTPRCPQNLLAALYYNSARGTTLPVPNPQLLTSNPLACAG